MNTEIKYNGYSSNPSDYLSPDGELQISLGLLKENGETRPLRDPKKLGTLDNGRTLLAVHNLPNLRKNYITKFYSEGVEKPYSVQYCGKLDCVAYTNIYSFTDDIKSVSVIGNTLVILLATGRMFYALWKENKYIPLGEGLPELNAKPYLSSTVVGTSDLYSMFGIKMESQTSYDFSDIIDKTNLSALEEGETTKISLSGETRKKIYERLFSIFNQDKRLFQKEGYFFEPFFVRVAYRLYDGTHTMHSDPILLVPTTWGVPIMGLRIKSSKATFDPIFTLSRLTLDMNGDVNFKNWKDIITHIDVFVSKPAISYTDSEEAVLSISQLPFLRYEVPEGGSLKEWLYEMEKDPAFMDKADGLDFQNLWSNIYDSYKNAEGTKWRVTNMDLYYAKPFRFYRTEGAEYCFLAIPKDRGVSKIKVYHYSKEIKPTTKIPEGLPYSQTDYDFYEYKDIELQFTSPYGKWGEGIKVDYDTDALVLNGPMTTSSIASDTHHYIELERVDKKNLNDVIRTTSNFYKVAEFKFEELIKDSTSTGDVPPNGFGFSGEVELLPNVLVTLEQQEQLSDTGLNRETIFADDIFPYNNRVNAIVGKLRMPDITSPLIQNPADGEEELMFYNAAYVRVVENGQTAYRKLSIDPEHKIFRRLDLRYFYYPRSSAKELILQKVFEDGEYVVKLEAKIPLTRHEFLNGAYYFRDINEGYFDFNEVSEFKDYGDDGIINYGNVIRTSSANNPFLFRDEDTSEIPVDKVLAISSATKALSEGQFGQFPLYAFTTDGVWALSVSDIGNYSAVQPISRDVISNPDSITQIDDAVIFNSDRGVMMVSGSQSLCISEIIDGKVRPLQYNVGEIEPVKKNVFPHLDELLNLAGYTIDDADIIDFKEYLKNARTVFDYTHQRLVMYNTDRNVKYAYVYSLIDKSWSMRRNDIAYSVRSYPDAIAVDKDNNVVDFTKDGDFVNGFLMTRPMKLDSANVLKSVSEIMQRGFFKKGSIRTALYGSRDLDNWFYISSSADHSLKGLQNTAPFKYYRLVVLSTMKDDESLYGASLEIKGRQTNNMK